MSMPWSPTSLDLLGEVWIPTPEPMAVWWDAIEEELYEAEILGWFDKINEVISPVEVVGMWDKVSEEIVLIECPGY